MKVSGAVCVMLAIAGGCGGRQMLDPPPDVTGPAGTNGGTAGGTAGAIGGTAGTSGAAGSSMMPTVGPIDLTQAPATFSMSCDHGVGIITFDNPCLVGFAIGGTADPSTPEAHEVECTLATPVSGIAWSFLLIFPPRHNPTTVFPLTPTGLLFDLGGGHQVGVAGAVGALTFSRVDPANRAFVARFVGTVTWAEPSGASFSCAVDTPLWGGPGGFT